jgi:hypothetical protein
MLGWGLALWHASCNERFCGTTERHLLYPLKGRATVYLYVCAGHHIAMDKVFIINLDDAVCSYGIQYLGNSQSS